jgi:hypothetical protein
MERAPKSPVRPRPSRFDAALYGRVLRPGALMCFARADLIKIAFELRSSFGLGVRFNSAAAH